MSQGLIFGFCLSLLLCINSNAQASFGPNEKLVLISTRPSVTLPFIFVRPNQSPTAAVVLFAGSNGLLKLTSDGIGSGADNFVVRTRQQYASAGFVTLVLDVPSDHSKGLGDSYRTSKDAAADVQAVMAWIRSRWDVPVWLVGTSRGTISAANVAARLGDDGPNGLILTSSITTGNNATLYDVALDQIQVPTLFVHHREDACPASPFSNILTLMGSFTGIQKHPFKYFDGGGPIQSGPCKPLSYHGYIGIEDHVIRSITSFISSH